MQHLRSNEQNAVISHIGMSLKFMKSFIKAFGNVMALGFAPNRHRSKDILTVNKFCWSFINITFIVKRTFSVNEDNINETIEIVLLY